MADQGTWHDSFIIRGRENHPKVGQGRREARSDAAAHT